MFRQIWIHPDDTKYQKIVWRPNSNEILQDYNLLTVTYGTACAPFLATQTLTQLAQDYQDEHPIASIILKRDFYMDDLMSGANSITEAEKAVQDLIILMNKGGFKLRKWTSNSAELLNCIPEANQEHSFINFEDSSKSVSVLGLQYSPIKDTFSFRVNIFDSQPTKRTMLSEASRVFDPIGWLSPVTVKFKILFQKLWLQKVDWDDELPLTIKEEWTNMKHNLKKIEEIQIRRWLFTEGDEYELHGFSDASENAYAAVIYSRVQTNEGIRLNIVSAKTKVAPINTISIPKLELCAAALLTNLMISVRKALASEEKVKNYFWTDSKIVLDWLSSCPKRWKTYVANRVSQILQHSNRRDWFHIPSKDNPADCASRGMFPNELRSFTLWWHGPEWLKQSNENWPPQGSLTNEDKEVLKEAREKQIVALNTYCENELVNNLIDRCSTFSKAVNVIARIIRIFKNTKLKVESAKISPEDSVGAFNFIIKEVQRNSFGVEIAALIDNRPILKNSKLNSLYPFLNNVGVLRVGGRLQNAEVPFDMKHQIIMPNRTRVTTLIIRDAHLKQLHAGPALLTSILNQKYNILRCKDEVRRVINHCIKCTRLKARQQQQLMGQLPISRVSFHRPFLDTGVDYAGPIMIRTSNLRGAKLIKAYFAVFICMATKAVHLEVVSDMTTESFLAALKRFQSRRGICAAIYSDNGSNFVGASRELKKPIESISKSDSIRSYLQSNSTNWHFIPPGAPNFGGLWEAAVKSTKYHLRRVLGETLLTYEEMATLLTQVEAILNSRPLCEMSSDQLDPLTPGHFLIGHPLTLIAEQNFMNTKSNKLSRFQHIQKMVQHFWQRWHNEYLVTLQQRRKWMTPVSNIKVDDLVVIIEKDTPPTKWLLGRIVEAIPGKDGMVRVVTIKTEGGLLKRPITKICVLSAASVESSGAGCSETP